MVNTQILGFYCSNYFHGIKVRFMNGDENFEMNTKTFFFMVIAFVKQMTGN